MRHVAAAVIGTFLCGCATTHSPLGAISDLKINGYEASSPDCASFRPSQRAISEFFARAAVVAGQTLHDHYEVYPSSAHGTFAAGHSMWSWTLQAGGTALVKSAGGEALVLADPKQETSPADR